MIKHALWKSTLTQDNLWLNTAILTSGRITILLRKQSTIANTPSHKIKFLDVAPVFARAIGHIHGATSIADLF